MMARLWWYLSKFDPSDKTFWIRARAHSSGELKTKASGRMGCWKIQEASTSAKNVYNSYIGKSEKIYSYIGRKRPNSHGVLFLKKNASALLTQEKEQPSWMNYTSQKF